MERDSGVTEQLCDYIAAHGVVRSTDIREAFPSIGTNLQTMLKHPLANRYLMSCIVKAEDRRGVMREIAEYRLSEAAKGRSYKEWKAKFDPATRGDLKPQNLPPRAAAALATAGPQETLAIHPDRPKARRTEAPQPEVGKNTGTAGLVTPTSAPFAEACSVAPTPAAERANATAAGGNETVATWCLHSDGSMQIAKGGVSLTLAPEEALRLAHLCGLARPYLDTVSPHPNRPCGLNNVY